MNLAAAVGSRPRPVNRLATIDSDIAVAVAAVDDTAAFLANGARPWFEADGVPVREEQTVLHRAGQIAVDLAIAQAARRRARALNTDAALAEARFLAGRVALDASSFLLEAGGTSTTDDARDFGRHWLSARRSTTQDALDAALLVAGYAALDTKSRDALPFTSTDTAPPTFADITHVIRTAEAVAAALLPGAARRDLDGTNPREELSLLARSGLLGITVPQRHGGPGFTYADGIEVSRHLSRADPSIGQIATVHFGTLETLVRTGSEPQLARWLPSVLAGARFGNAAAERGVTHAKITATRLSRHPSGNYRLNGRKFYSTGAFGADAVIILAITDDDETRSIIVPATARGFTILDDWKSLGQRGTSSGTTILDNIEIEPVQVLPTWLNASVPSLGTASANLGHVAVDLGIARAAHEDACALIRRGPGKPSAQILQALGRHSATLNAAEALFAEVLERLRGLDRIELTVELTQQFSLEVSVIKVYAGELALSISEALFDIAGEVALERALGLDRHWRNVRTHTLHDPNRWRYLRIGDYVLNGRLPPRNRSN
jgi:alkylation response protein AidB-like acyl-CoA dehydrogenase